MRDFVSIIVPVFNDPIRIRMALDALLTQTLPQDSYEVIITDNGSTDSTPQVIKEYCTKYPNIVRLVFERQIQSSYAARNKGLREARGKILAFTDSDCVPAQNWIAAGIRALQYQKAACGGGRITFFFKSVRPNIYEYLDSARKLNQQAYIEQAGFSATANFFAHRELFDRYGEFRYNLISGGDYEFGRRLTTAGEKMIYISDAIVQHPARSSFKEILKKSSRVAAGQKKLEYMGRLEHGTLTWRKCLPKIRYPRDGYWSKNLSVMEKIQLVFLANFFRYLNLWKRIR